MKIGTFHRDQSGAIIGTIYGLGLGAVPVSFDQEISRDNRKYFRLTAEPGDAPYEIGVAFPKEKNGKTYYSVSIESPFLPMPINAALFPDRENKGNYSLIWNRQEPRSLKSEASVTDSGSFATPNLN
jgi:uncharacterized protein (DUF736 family)